MFTATLAGYAQAQGKLSLTDHPGQYMPALRGSALDKASLINLATYTAGLPLHLPNAIKTFAEAEAFLQNLKIKAEPGAVRLYSNPSVGLVGHIAALAMNANFPDLMETQLLPKLGVRDCFIRIPSSRAQDYAQGYKGNTPRRMGQAVFDAEAYGLKCTASGLLRFVEDNIRPDTLEPALRRAVETTHVGYSRIGDMVQGFRLGAISLPGAAEATARGQFERHDLQAERREPARSAARAVRAHAVQQDRRHGRLQRLCGVRAGAADRHRHSGEQEHPDAGARHRRFIGAGRTGAGP